MVDRIELLMKGFQPVILESILYGVDDYDIYLNALIEMKSKDIDHLLYVFADDHESINYQAMTFFLYYVMPIRSSLKNYDSFVWLIRKKIDKTSTIGRLVHGSVNV